MKASKWFLRLSKTCLGSVIIGGKKPGLTTFDWEISYTDGWDSWIEVPKIGYAVLWHDRYTGKGPRRLYVGFELTQKVFELTYQHLGHNFREIIEDKDITNKSGKTSINEKRLKHFDYSTPFFERYKRGGRRCFFGKYFEAGDPNKDPKSASQLLPQLTDFIEKNCRDILSWMDDEGSKEWTSYDTGIRGQRHISSKLKNEAKKRENYTCEACGYRLNAGKGNWIIEVHHQKQMKEGERVTKSSQLTVLCPNCHMVAHSNKKRPLPLAHIRKRVARIRKALKEF